MWCCFLLILVVEGGRCKFSFGWYVLQWVVTGKKKKKKMKTLVIKKGSLMLEEVEVDLNMGTMRILNWVLTVRHVFH